MASAVRPSCACRYPQPSASSVVSTPIPWASASSDWARGTSRCRKRRQRAAVAMDAGRRRVIRAARQLRGAKDRLRRLRVFARLLGQDGEQMRAQGRRPLEALLVGAAGGGGQPLGESQALLERRARHDHDGQQPHLQVRAGRPPPATPRSGARGGPPRPPPDRRRGAGSGPPRAPPPHPRRPDRRPARRGAGCRRPAPRRDRGWPGGRPPPAGGPGRAAGRTRPGRRRRG